ncbi:signal peptidase II [Candidatus Vallotia cooleyia]|uniref:signal peptidase II n=1 Tax=Candidatus Vallotiella adelgis TaxID=1177211 RepID=UPI001D023457|nr:signal peptidase II [Candidatus Vallotia cooleyia]UDG82135.1 Lipoprotein signal peptidase [Candidatus Vallotia cooleyia]
MAKTSFYKSSRSEMLMLYLGMSLIVILLDQLSKIMVTRLFVYGDPYPVTSFFNLLLVYNLGGAFNFLSTASGWQRWVFISLGISSALLIIYLLKGHSGQKLFCTALALILGGGLSNVIDRFMHGYVIDFLDFYVGNWHWPTFNIADSSITNGALLLALDELRRVRVTH